LPGVWEITAVIRACVALFCFSAVAGGRPAYRSPCSASAGWTDFVHHSHHRTISPWLAVAAVPAVALLASWLHAPNSSVAQDSVELGRQVYVAEGCIHCHSQFIRPNDASLDWGEARDPDFSRRQQPALIGNRRQGPDLMNVGLRRSRERQRVHLSDPRSVVPTSRIPSYAHLFASRDGRGPALLDFLDSLGRESSTRSSIDSADDIPVAGRPVARHSQPRFEK